MRVLVQRVAEAWVEIEGRATPKVGRGLLALVGFHREDDEWLLEPMAAKLMQLRVFEDEAGRMNLSLAEIGGSLVLVPQFTLYADVRKGRRPGFTEALAPELAGPMYGRFVECCRRAIGSAISGEFGATMQVHLVNDGPVTILLDSRELNLSARRASDA